MNISAKFDGILLNFWVSSGVKCENLVDLEKRCKMIIWLQKSALIQRRTDRLGSTSWTRRPAQTFTTTWLRFAAKSTLQAPVLLHVQTTKSTFWTPNDGPFSSVSTPIFASKYTFCSIFSSGSTRFVDFFLTESDPASWAPRLAPLQAQKFWTN